MPSFLEKALQTATRAKAQVDELRAARAAAAVAPVDAGPLGAHERGVLEHAIERGAPDPFGLLTREEAASVLDAPVGAPSLTYTDDAIGVRFAANGPRGAAWSLSASVYHGTDAGDADGKGYWQETVLDAYGDAEPVAGLGDQALWTAPYLFVLLDATVFYLEVVTPDGPDDARARAVDAASIVAKRLGSR